MVQTNQLNRFALKEAYDVMLSNFASQQGMIINYGNGELPFLAYLSEDENGVDDFDVVARLTSEPDLAKPGEGWFEAGCMGDWTSRKYEGLVFAVTKPKDSRDWSKIEIIANQMSAMLNQEVNVVQYNTSCVEELVK